MSTTEFLSFERPHVLYMIEHTGLRLRKVGIGTSKRARTCSRLDGWRRCGWAIVEIQTFGTAAAVREAEIKAIRTLDSLGARSTDHIGSIYPNLAVAGRTEMYDPTRCAVTLTDLLALDCGDAAEPPPWISEPRLHAAAKAIETRKAMSAARRAARSATRSEAARKAWATRRSRSAGSAPSEQRGDAS